MMNAFEQRVIKFVFGCSVGMIISTGIMVVFVACK